MLAEYPDDLRQDEDNNITIEYETAAELETCHELAQAAYKREFDAEEHECTICSRSLLGDKITLLTSCEHFFCTECLDSRPPDKLHNCYQCGKDWNFHDANPQGKAILQIYSDVKPEVETLLKRHRKTVKMFDHSVDFNAYD